MPSKERLRCPGILRLVIFDMDGCLYPADPRFDAAYPAAAIEMLVTHLGLEPAEAERVLAERKAELARRIGGRPTNTLTLLSCWPEIPFEDYEKAVDRRIDVEGLLQVDPLAVEAVGRVGEQFEMALFTTNNGRTASRVLDAIGMGSFFPPERRFTTSHIGALDLPRDQQMAHVKPGLRGFRHLLGRFGVAPPDALMVGDSEISDMSPARELGMGAYRIGTAEDLYHLPAWLGLAL